MSWVIVNGIRVLLDEGAVIDDYHGLVTDATAKMIQFRESWGDDEVFAITRIGDLYTLQRINGQDEVIMGPVERPPEPEDDRRFLEIDPDLNYCPAFHTYDSEGTFVGLTICLAGKWGPPYQFVGVEETDVWDFWNGWWNYYAGATRPEDYEEQRWIAEFDGSDIFEVPADHEYIAQDNYIGQDTQVLTRYTGGEEIHVYVCSPSEAYLYGYRHAQYETTGITTTDLLLWVDWNGAEADQVRIASYSVIHEVQGPMTILGAGIYAWGTGPPTACERAWEQVADWYTDWDSILYQGYFTGYPGGAAHLDWNIVGTYGGAAPSMNGAWGTFYDMSAEAGFYYCGLSTYGRYYTDVGGRYWPTPSDSVSNDPDFRTIVEYPGDTSHDFVSVFGEQYNLEYSADDYYSRFGRRLRTVRPRIYLTDTESKVALASVVRQDKTVFEYHCFSPWFHQIGDPDAQYEYISDYKHTLPITVGDEPVFGNGEFSLVVLDNQEFDTYLDRGEPEDLSTPIVEL